MLTRLRGTKKRGTTTVAQDGHRPFGAPGGIRTPDQWLRKPLLYPAELQARATYSPMVAAAVRALTDLVRWNRCPTNATPTRLCSRCRLGASGWRCIGNWSAATARSAGCCCCGRPGGDCGSPPAGCRRRGRCSCSAPGSG